MSTDPVASVRQALRSSNKDQIEPAIRALGAQLPELSPAEFRGAVEALCSLFYIDTYDRPDLEPALELTVGVLAQHGGKVVPLLLEFMEGSDIKSHLYLAQTLGLIGRPALEPLRRFVATAEDAYGRSFALFAIGKLHDPIVHEAPEVLGSLIHPDKEVRDSAARVIGKIAEIVPPEALTDRRRAELFDLLHRALDDKQPAVRAKVVRSLGKVAAARYLNAEQVARLRSTLRRLLGEDEHYDWDRAYIVRREAEEALGRLP